MLHTKNIKNSITLPTLVYSISIYLFIYSKLSRSLIPFSVVLFGLLVYGIVRSKRKGSLNFRSFYFVFYYDFISYLLFFRRVKTTTLFVNFIRENRSSLIAVLIYVILVVPTLSWGSPNVFHPLSYNMDEWTIVQGIRFLYGTGSNNQIGGCLGFLFYFFQAGIYLLPFVAFHIFNPFAIRSTIAHLSDQHTLFLLLRLNTVFYGIGAILLLGKIAKKHVNSSSLFVGLLIVSTPLFLVLSGYFVYEVTALFFILLSLHLMLSMIEIKSFDHVIITMLVVILTISTRVTTIPLLFLYVVAYIIWHTRTKNAFRNFLLSILIGFFFFLIFAIPDEILGKANTRLFIQDYLIANGVKAPQNASYFVNGIPTFIYLFLHDFPINYGYFLISIFVLSFTCEIIYLIQHIRQKQRIHISKEAFLLFSFFIFWIYTWPLKLTAGGRRSIIFFPFFVLFSALWFHRIMKNKKKLVKIPLIILMVFGMALQLLQSFAMISLKLFPDTKSVSSQWMISHIPKHSDIGVEGVLAYQGFPDILLTDEFKQVPPQQMHFNYIFMNVGAQKYPQYILITNIKDVIHTNDNLIKIVEKSYYKKIAEFTPYNSFYSFFYDHQYSTIIPTSTVDIFMKR